MEEKQVISLEQKINPEAAQQQVDLFLDYYEVELDDFEDKKVLNAIKTAMNKIKKAVMRCRIEIKLENNSLVILQTLKHPFDRTNASRMETIKYKSLRGQAKTRLKYCDENDDYGKVYALMGGLCGEPDSTMQMLEGVDLTVVEAISSIFLAA